MGGKVNRKYKALAPEACCTPWNLFLSSIPMMLSILSGALMQLTDRYFLGHYSLGAFTGATVAQQNYSALMLPCLCFAGMAEVFVGQFNGAKKYKQTSVPILQIAFFLIILEFLCVPIFIHYRHHFLPDEFYAEAYPFVLVGLGIIPFQILHASFSAFFVGTRRANLILPSVIVANLLNVALDPLFIFGSARCGLGVWLLPQGAAGAAWATLCCTILSAAMLGYFYFHRTNAELYDTRHWHWDTKILKKNIALGAPYAFAIFVEMANWVRVAKILAETSSYEVELNSLSLGLWNFLFFMIEGLQKGVMATASNLIGAKRMDKISDIVRSSGKIAVAMLFFASLPFLVFARPVFAVLFDVPDIYVFPNALGVLAVQWISFAILCFTLGGLIAVLCAGGDTFYVTCVRLACCVLCVIVPVQLIAHFSRFTTLHSWALGLVNMLMAGVFNYLRYRSGKWKHKVISSSPGQKKTVPEELKDRDQVEGQE